MTHTSNPVPPIDPDALASIDPDTLARALAESRERVAYDVTLAAASATLSDALAAAAQNLADLAAAGAAAGLAAPDPSALVAAAITRAAPVAPDVLAAVVAPDPDPLPSPVAAAAPGRRNSYNREWSNVPRGSEWDCRLMGNVGRVAIYPRADGTATFRTLTGTAPGTSYESPSRAVQSACGDPTTSAPSVAERGRVAATVNGWQALTRTTRRNGQNVRERLIDVAAPTT